MWSLTLGSLLRYSKEAGIVGLELQSKVEELLEERNWLIHRSLRMNGDDFYVSPHRERLMERLSEFSMCAMNLQKLLVKELEDFVVSRGVSRQWISSTAGRVSESFVERRPLNVLREENR